MLGNFLIIEISWRPSGFADSGCRYPTLVILVDTDPKFSNVTRQDVGRRLQRHSLRGRPTGNPLFNTRRADTAFKIGYQHGSAAKAEISRSIAFYASLFIETSNRQWPQVLDTAKTFDVEIQRKWPRYREEMRGQQSRFCSMQSTNVLLTIRNCGCLWPRYSRYCCDKRPHWNRFWTFYRWLH